MRDYIERILMEAGREAALLQAAETLLMPERRSLSVARVCFAGLALLLLTALPAQGAAMIG